MKPVLSQSAPHIRRGRTTTDIMLDVLIALVPAVIAAVWNFGSQAVWLLAVTTISCAVTQWLCLLLRGEGEFDGSALVTGVLLALSLPADTSLWASALAGAFAIALIKEAFGGIGHNLFNPAMAARGLLLVAFPATLNGYTRPDAVSSATPLSSIGDPAGVEEWLPMFTGFENGSMGETSVLLILAGGIYLYLRGAIRLRLPVTCLGVFGLVVWIFGGSHGLFTGPVVTHLLSGGLMLGAFFMITDFTTKPTTFWGELVFAAGVGGLTAVLRLWGPYPEGVCFAILLMNLAAPVLEYLTRARVYGLKNLLGGIRPLKKAGL